MAGFRVRRGDLEMTIPDADSVVRFLRNGRLRATDEVLVDDRWIALSKAPPFRLHTAETDPWAAWSDADEVDADAVIKDVADRAPDAIELPVAAVIPMAPALEARPLPEIPHQSVEPVEDDPTPVTPVGAVVQIQAAQAAPRPAPTHAPVRSVEPAPVVNPAVHPPLVAPTMPPPGLPTVEPRAIPFRGSAAPRSEADADGRGEVISFPKERVRPPELVRPKPPERSPAVRPLRVVMMVAVGLVLLVGAWAWVRIESSIGPAPAPPAPEPSAEPRPNHSGAGHQASATDASVAVERELRAVQLGDPRPIKRDGDLGDAILIDLQRLKVDILDVRAPVTRWSGKHADTPITAEVHIQYRARSGELVRELGAIAISVGRYININRLKVDPFEVYATTEEGTVLYKIDPQRAEDFARGRISLKQLIPD